MLSAEVRRSVSGLPNDDDPQLLVDLDGTPDAIMLRDLSPALVAGAFAPRRARAHTGSPVPLDIIDKKQRISLQAGQYTGEIADVSVTVMSAVVEYEVELPSLLHEARYDLRLVPRDLFDTPGRERGGKVRSIVTSAGLLCAFPMAIALIP